ncbi:MAG: hypothetical protein LH660_09585 [Phormidesmis sp. CAN_BIN36]|nr:hypothetical protein [Phormidesmis sp. CAN_BIN36]
MYSLSRLGASESCPLIPKRSPVPEETARVAKLALPKGNCYLTLRDHIGTLYSDPDFTHLFSGWGQTAIAPWR